MTGLRIQIVDRRMLVEAKGIYKIASEVREKNKRYNPGFSHRKRKGKNPKIVEVGCYIKHCIKVIESTKEV